MQQVQEFFGDFVVMDPQHFCIPLPRSHVVLQPFGWDYANSTDAVARMTEGLASLTLSLRRRFNIRWVALLHSMRFTATHPAQQQDVLHTIVDMLAAALPQLADTPAAIRCIGHRSMLSSASCSVCMAEDTTHTCIMPWALKRHAMCLSQ